MQERLAAHEHQGEEVVPQALDGGKPVKVALVLVQVEEALLGERGKVDASPAA